MKISLKINMKMIAFLLLMCFSIFGSCICCSQKAVIKYYSDNKKRKSIII